MASYPELDRYRDANIDIGYRWQAGQPGTDDPTLQPRWNTAESFCLMAAASGVFNMRGHNPAQPYSPKELTEAAIESARAGATAIHLHVRDPLGRPSGKIEYWREAVGGIREACGRSVVISGSTVRGDTIDEKMAPVMEGLFEACPVNIDPRYPPEFIRAQASILADHGVKVEMAVFDSGGVDLARQLLIDTLVVKPPYLWLMVPALPRAGSLGMPNPMAMVEGIAFLLHRIREVTPDAVIGVAASARPSSRTLAGAPSTGKKRQPAASSSLLILMRAVASFSGIQVPLV